MKRPNILFLHTDQQRWDTLKANGNDIIKTPNLDRLAEKGTNFDHCFSQNPVCMPSRISLMSGQYCSALDITHMAVTVPEDTLTIQKILSNYGYYNALIGKLHYLPHSNRDHHELHPDYDFDHMELSDEPGCYEDAYRSWVKKKAPEQLDNISLGLPPVTEIWQRIIGFEDNINHPEQRFPKEAKAFPADSDLTHTAFVGEQTKEFLKENKDKSFFCFSGFYSPHSPWVAPQKYLDLYDEEDMPVPDLPEEYKEKLKEKDLSEKQLKNITKGYYAMISEVDHWIGEILDTLEELGIADNTIIVFTSDHGEWLGEHLKFGKGYWAPDVVSRVPLIINVPEKLGGATNRQISEIVECVDVVPTLLELAGIPVPAEIQGEKLPVNENDESYDGDGLGLTEYAGWKSVRMDGFRYVIEEDGSEHLYDIEKDPNEYTDVAGEEKYKEVLSEVRKRLLEKMLQIEKPLTREWAY